MTGVCDSPWFDDHLKELCMESVSLLGDPHATNEEVESVYKEGARHAERRASHMADLETDRYDNALSEMYYHQLSHDAYKTAEKELDKLETTKNDYDPTPFFESIQKAAFYRDLAFGDGREVRSNDPSYNSFLLTQTSMHLYDRIQRTQYVKPEQRPGLKLDFLENSLFSLFARLAPGEYAGGLSLDYLYPVSKPVVLGVGVRASMRSAFSDYGDTRLQLNVSPPQFSFGLAGEGAALLIQGFAWYHDPSDLENRFSNMYYEVGTKAYVLNRKISLSVGYQQKDEFVSGTTASIGYAF